MSYLAARLSVGSAILMTGLATAASLKAVVLTWRHRHRSRNELARMSERDRRDLGYSACDVGAETGKPFWIP